MPINKSVELYHKSVKQGVINVSLVQNLIFLLLVSVILIGEVRAVALFWRVEFVIFYNHLIYVV